MSENFEQIPTNSEELIVMLDKMIPEKCPSAEELNRNLYQVAVYSGKRELVRMLLAKLKNTLNNKMEGIK
jgi:hypothetical protein